jgi:hypothetical protein
MDLTRFSFQVMDLLSIRSETQWYLLLPLFFDGFRFPLGIQLSLQIRFFGSRLNSLEYAFLQEIKAMENALPTRGRILDESSVSKFSVRVIFRFQ